MADCLICGVACKSRSSKFCSLEHYREAVSQKKYKHPMTGIKFSDDRRIAISERLKGERNPNYGNHNPKHSEEFKQMIREKLNPPGRNYGHNKGRKLNLKDDHRRALAERVSKTNERGFDNRGGRCKFFMVDGVLLQGRYELRFYLESEVKPRRPERIKTPFGWYSPDFEFDDCFVEIKSTYTIKTCIANGQAQKINWVRQNIKPVKIMVLKESETIEYLSTFDLEAPRYCPSNL